MVHCASGHLEPFQAASIQVFVLGSLGSSAVVMAGGCSANKNSFIFIYCFTFPIGRRELQLPQCWKTSIGRPAAAEEVAKSTRNVPKTQENKIKMGRKKCAHVAKHGQKLLFFSESEFYLLFTAQGVFIILLTCRVDCNFYCRTSANT